MDKATGSAPSAVRTKRPPVIGHIPTERDRLSSIFDVDERLAATRLEPADEFPKFLARCPIFLPVQREAQRELLDTDNAMRFEYTDGSGRRHGPAVSIDDEDTLLALLRLRQMSLRAPGALLPIPQATSRTVHEVQALCCSIGEIGQVLGTQSGGLNNRVRVQSLQRLTAVRIELAPHSADASGARSDFKLIEVRWDRFADRGQLYVQFTPAVTRMLVDSSVPLDLEVRRQLTSTGKAIHRYLCGQPKSYCIAADTLRRRIGYLRSIGSFTRDLRDSLARLKSLSWLRSYEIDGTGRRCPFNLRIRR